MHRFDRSTTAFQEFIASMRQHWANRMYPALVAEYRARAAGDAPDSAEAAGALLSDSATYRWFGFVERHFQRMKYSDPQWGLAAAFERDPEGVARALAAAEGSRYLTLDPELAIPAYYRAVDIHQHPGNLVGAPYDGLMYLISAASIHPTTRRFEAHERFAAWLADRGRFERVLDMGCGFGKSTLPIARAFPEAEVIGIELSEPCLRLAAVMAEESGPANVHFAQKDALRTGHADGSFDLVTSTQLLHELPLREVRNLLAESFRLSRPGGWVVHLDFRCHEPWKQFLIEGHAVRNNEGYLPQFNRMDMQAALRAAGFEEVGIEPFAEAEGVTDPAWPYWRFPWTLFAGRRPLK
ncbi:MAG: methyltransferase domain-containing protein [Burkholderiales bacterium]|nr:MAG: methyltransferase domain-containing protein [Burkholderiales bacterium]